LHPILVELGVAFGEGNPACGVRRFADANENFHGDVFKIWDRTEALPQGAQS
jgi:hypothetical protein